MEKGMKTERVMISCKIFSSPIFMTLCPIRFAGTWSKYSNKAIPQLTNTATIQGLWEKFFKCPYQANVIKKLLQINMKAVRR